MINPKAGPAIATRMAPPKVRRQFILDYLAELQGGSVDVLDSDFVNDYIEETGASAEWPAYGAPRCPQLGRDLSAMAAGNVLVRERCGLRGMEWGFPRWVWVYELARR